MHRPSPALVMGRLWIADLAALKGRPWVAHSMQESACGLDAASAPRDWEWPLLAGVEVWGWRRDVGAAQVAVLLPGDSCDGFEVVQSIKLESSQVRAVTPI
jgi:hypothetical protein